MRRGRFLMTTWNKFPHCSYVATRKLSKFILTEKRLPEKETLTIVVMRMQPGRLIQGRRGPKTRSESLCASTQKKPGISAYI